MEKAVKFISMIKRYAGFQLGALDFEIEPGRVVGYIGPNGSGKTTTMHCLMGLVRADEGKMEIFGMENDMNEIGWKLKTGYVGDKHVFFENWSVAKNLNFISGFYPDWDNKFAEELLKRFDLQQDKKAKDLSTGNRVKLSLIQALAHRPQLLLLDEPTSGLDPVVRAEVQEVLFDFVETGDSSILYSTHILPDISRLADELIFLKNGKVILQTEKDELVDKWRTITFYSENEVGNLKDVHSVKKEGNFYKVISGNFSETLQQLHDLKSEKIESSIMTIDEIAVQILKN